ncbi:hypothetical protein J40TS1_38610 [Paenibacillus montaniterrae]|uniref:Uncharacterized protein n=1 Tax=Paenibacillus montaniterrae TaxID=429341 RepID=A0A920D0R6_9BACL|nr:hypothetical protein J40TS1_38610 [Paenibacillus montaniterrae]
MKKIFIGLLLTLSVLFSTSSTTYASDYIFEINSNNAARMQEERIQEIYEERARVQSEMNEGYEEKLEELQKDLESLGVEFLTDSEVKSKLRATGQITPFVETPKSNNITWSSYRNPNWVLNGVKYEVQHLTAESNSKPSTLTDSQTISLQSSSSWKVGLQNFVLTAAKEGVSTINTGVGIALTVYDAVKSFISDSNFTKSTTVSNVKASYTTSFYETIDFMYVKKVGQQDKDQVLSFVTNSMTGKTSWVVPKFSYNKYNGATESVEHVTGTRSFDYKATGHRNGSFAVHAYVDPMFGSHSMVTRVQITGIEDQTVQTIIPRQYKVPGYVK